MPNHVENNIKLSGDPSAIRRMLEAIKSDEYGLGTIDFNKVTPMPESLKIEAGSRTDRGLKAYKDFVSVYTLAGTMNLDNLDRIPRESEEIFLRQRTDIDRKDWEFGRTAWNNIRQYGSPTWYEWSIGHWGTKWNAYGYDKSQDYSQSGELWFQTAWGAPHPVIQKLAERFPEISFEHEWADEDIGNNCGRYTYSDGERIEEYYPEGKAAMDFAFNVWGHDPLDYDLFENSTGTAYIDIEDADYELVDIMGVPALFTNDRLTAADIPKGMYCYDIRDDGTGENLTLEPYARVNHFASIVTKIPINFNGEDHILLTGDDEIGFYAQECTFGQFMDENFTILQDNKILYRGTGYPTELGLNAHIINKLLEIAKVTGERLRGLGYRGICGLDFIVYDDTVLFIEINARYLGSTFLINKALKEQNLPSVFELNTNCFNDDALPVKILHNLNIGYNSFTLKSDSYLDKNNIRDVIKTIESKNTTKIYWDGLESADSVLPNSYLYRGIY